jgi:glycosyltransferase involved in cell wall biosynthesis
MYAGCAVVTTTIGNLGVQGKDGRDLLVRDSDDELLDALVSLLSEPKYAATLGAAGRSFVRRTYAWAASLALIRQHWLAP